MIPEELSRRVERWIAEDPDSQTRAELEAMLAQSGCEPELVDRFSGSLEFGTAGLRGVVAAGPNRMNRAVVRRVTWGVAQELLRSVPDAAQRGVVIGRDARRGSTEFAADAAAVLAAAGIRVSAFADPIPTPVVAFAARRSSAAAAIVITASHNPPEYNGYKVYWSDGAPIASPVDAHVARAIAQSPPARDVPRPDWDELVGTGQITMVSSSVAQDYLDAAAAKAAKLSSPQAGRGLRIVYTALHGVGDRWARQALQRAGFDDVMSVAEQQTPDGAFPTLAFPNPEDPAVLALAVSRAREMRADLVLANDPDADRLAVAVADPGHPEKFRPLTGNEVGALLGRALLRRDVGPRAEGEKRAAVVTTIVSSPLLGCIAADAGARCDEVLTGFKWIARRGLELEQQGYAFVFGFEEALGYCFGGEVWDKDGIAAAVLVAALAADLRMRGRTLLDELEGFARRWGLFASAQRSLVCKGADGPARLANLMAKLRVSPPEAIAGEPVHSVTDYLAGRALPPSDVLGFGLGARGRVVIRPSGTEPKAKVYLDVCEPVAPGEAVNEAARRARVRLERLAEAFVESVLS